MIHAPPCAGIQTNRPFVVSVLMSPSTVAAMRPHVLASGLLADVARNVPPAAAARILLQSVMTGVSHSTARSTKNKDQSSEAAAVLTDGGGRALPKATRSPADETTTSDEPAKDVSHATCNLDDLQS